VKVPPAWTLWPAEIASAGRVCGPRDGWHGKRVLQPVLSTSTPPRVLRATAPTCRCFPARPAATDRCTRAHSAGVRSVSPGADVRRGRTRLLQLRGAGSHAAITVFAIRDGRGCLCRVDRDRAKPKPAFDRRVIASVRTGGAQFRRVRDDGRGRYRSDDYVRVRLRN
jgi:hypothetical protein